LFESALSNAMGKRKTEDITEPQANTLRTICAIVDGTGLTPTVKELADALGISHASAHEQIAQLVRKGYLKKEDRKARSIVVVRRLA
jgi:repressor LexA